MASLKTRPAQVSTKIVNQKITDVGPWNLKYITKQPLFSLSQQLEPQTPYFNSIELIKPTKFPKIFNVLQINTRKERQTINLSETKLVMKEHQQNKAKMLQSNNRFQHRQNRIFNKSKGIPSTERKSFQFPKKFERYFSIDFDDYQQRHQFQRRVPNIKIGLPISSSHSLQNQNEKMVAHRKILMNAECAKKRGLVNFIKQIKNNNLLQEYVVQNFMR